MAQLEWHLRERAHLREFARKLIATRKAFRYCTAAGFGRLHNEELDVKDVAWLSHRARRLTTEQWQDGNASASECCSTAHPRKPEIKRRGSDATMLLVYNAHS